MARRKGEVQLQREIENQEEWEDMLSKEGLCVVDVYQAWCGPAAGMLGTFKRIKNEFGDPLLAFAIAKADTIDALEKYRGRCEPCFLFYGGGVLVAVVRGANAPLILRTITEQLAQEHKVIDGQAERKEIRDPFVERLEAKERKAQEEEEQAAEEEAAKKQVSVVIIKPDAIQNGMKDQIIQEMRDKEIEILKEEERTMTEDEAREFYSHLQDEDYFEDLVKFMSSSPCCVLAITKGQTGENVVQEFRDLLGPTQVDEAKEQAPESLRAKYGSDKYMNAVHGSDSTDTAARELAFFFPDFVVPTAEGAVKPKVQRTLALIRPDAYRAKKDEIIAKIREAGFKIAMQKEVHLDKEQAEDFYSEHRGQEYFDELTTRMSSGPLLALGLAREEAITGWRQMLGPPSLDDAKEQAPDSLRAQFAIDDVPLNQLHGSDSEEQAKKEIQYFFPMEQTVAVIKPDGYGTKDEIITKIHDAGFRIAARKETTLSREIAEEFYQDHKDKDYYNDLVEHMVSGPTCFMVLSREGAVDGWRSLIGPTDPEKAREQDPESIRGQHGSSILQNAVHGSSNPDHAQQAIQKIFGDLKFNTDGTVKEEGEDEDKKEEKQDEQQADEQKQPQQQPDDKPASPPPADQEPSKPDEDTTQTTQDESKPQEEDATQQQTPTEDQQQKQQPETTSTTDENKPAEEEKPAESQDTQQKTTEEESKPDSAQEEPQQDAGESKPQEAQAEEPKQDESPAQDPPQDEQKPAETQEEQKPAETQGEDKKEEEKKEEEKKEEEKKEDEQKPAEEQQGDAKPDSQQTTDAS